MSGQTTNKRATSATIRHLLSRQESSLPIKLIALVYLNIVLLLTIEYNNIIYENNTANRIRIGTHRLEDERSAINL